MKTGVEINSLPQFESIPSTLSRQIILSGHVQGVGFRPFVYRLAKQYKLHGWVQNRIGQVAVVVQGESHVLDQFVGDLIKQAPALSRPQVYSQQDYFHRIYDNFSILESSESSTPQVFVPPDYFTCDDCLEEFNDPANRRYRYPFINCTQCGPRYTLIQGMPYDRINTTMVRFDMCKACRNEYENPLERRFHAEPIACPQCGPQLTFCRRNHPKISGTEKTIDAAVKALQQGEIVAVKGIGGYHLMCDAKNNNAVMRLRKRKFRPDKPLAVMFPGKREDQLHAVTQNVALTDGIAKLLSSPMRPILLAPKKKDNDLAEAIAPGLAEIGVLLPYTPLHYLLLNDFNGPLVATSGNLSGEPVLTHALQAEIHLQNIADAFVHHDRYIQHSADDPVIRFIDNRPQMIRVGRSYAPLEINLPWHLEKPLLAVGGHLKNTVALAWDNRVVVSPHIGEMNSPQSMDMFEQVITDLQSLYGLHKALIICDTHPGYSTHRWAFDQGQPVHTVYHHFAHASALVGEHQPLKPVLVFTWDGIGYGADGNLWGGETLYGTAGNWQRVASMQPFNLIGGDKVSREPWRSAAALCWQTGYPWHGSPKNSSSKYGSPINTSQQLTFSQQVTHQPISQYHAALVHHAWQRGLNCSQCSSAGRIFDAAAALVTGITKTTFEGQAPMLLEALADSHGEITQMPMSTDKKGILRIDWSPLVPKLADKKLSMNNRAAGFHLSLANNILEQAIFFRQQKGIEQIGLCGGVFQNKRLVELSATMLRDNGFELLLAKKLPVNDAAISFGQVIEYTAKQKRH